MLARVDDEIDEVEDDTWSFFVLGLGLMIPAVVGFLLFLRNRDWL